MKKIKNIILCAGVVAILFLVGTVQVNAKDEDNVSKKETLVLATWAPPPHPMNKFVFPWIKKQLNSCSKGTLDLDVKYKMGPPPKMFDIVNNGKADITWVYYGYVRNRFETTTIVSLPLVKNTTAEMSSVALQTVWDKYLSKSEDIDNTIVLANFAHGPAHLMTKKRIQSYSQVKGLTIRVGGLAKHLAESLGMKTAYVSPIKLKEKMLNNEIDGAYFPISHNGGPLQIVDVAKYIYINPYTYTTSFGILMNKAKYNNLSNGHRACIDKISGVNLSRVIGKIWDKADNYGKLVSQKKGGEVTEASNDDIEYFLKATKDYNSQIIKTLNDKGVDSKKAINLFKKVIKREQSK